MSNDSCITELDKKFIIPAYDIKSSKYLNVCRGQFISWCRRTLNLDTKRELTYPENQIEYLKKFHKSIEQEILRCLIISEIVETNKHRDIKCSIDVTLKDLNFHSAWNTIMENPIFFNDMRDRRLIHKDDMYTWEEPSGRNLSCLNTTIKKAYLDTFLKSIEKEKSDSVTTEESKEKIKEEKLSIEACLSTFIKINNLKGLTLKDMFTRLKLYFKTDEICEYFEIKRHTIAKVMEGQRVSIITFDKIQDKIKSISLIRN